MATTRGGRGRVARSKVGIGQCMMSEPSALSLQAPPWPHCHLRFPRTAPRRPMAAAQTTSPLPGVWAWPAAPVSIQAQP